MSAIYGAINLKGELLPNNIGKSFTSEYDRKKCKIDRYEQIENKSLYMGCGIQYFTEEAKYEKLPIADIDRGFYFSADVVLDNRKSLIDKLKENDTNASVIKAEESENIETCADGELLFRAFLKWGDSFPNYVRGVFSVALYDEKKKMVKLYADHFSSRCLYYYCNNDTVYFSTLLFPLINAIEDKLELNKRWLLDEITVRGPVMELEPRETAVEGIKKIEAGTSLTITLSGDRLVSEEQRYWNPNSIKPDKSIYYKKSEELMRDTFTAAVENCLHGNGPISIQLSSGLDSTAVGCIAARKLASNNEKLYSFTSVPDKKAGLENNKFKMYDETEGVLEVCRAYPNIEATFIDSADRNYLYEAKDIIDIWELPCKSQQNAVWVDEVYRRAAELGSRIILSGATGNCTVSAGNIESAIYNHLKHFRFKKANKILELISKMGGSRKKYLKHIFSLWINYYLWYVGKNRVNIYDASCTDAKIGERFKVNKRLVNRAIHVFPFITEKEHRRQIYMSEACSQIGQIDTKNSIQYGVLPRDPMRTVEVVELCYRIPFECYVGPDYDRRIIRESMAGIVPDIIRHNVLKRGVQSGDNEYRIDTVFTDLYDDIERVLLSDEVAQFLGPDKINKYLSVIRENNAMERSDEARMITDAYSFGIYLRKVLELVTNGG